LRQREFENLDKVIRSGRTFYTVTHNFYPTFKNNKIRTIIETYHLCINTHKHRLIYVYRHTNIFLSTFLNPKFSTIDNILLRKNLKIEILTVELFY
jgi:hypothetical protein